MSQLVLPAGADYTASSLRLDFPGRIIHEIQSTGDVSVLDSTFRWAGSLILAPVHTGDNPILAREIEAFIFAWSQSPATAEIPLGFVNTLSESIRLTTSFIDSNGCLIHDYTGTTHPGVGQLGRADNRVFQVADVDTTSQTVRLNPPIIADGRTLAPTTTIRARQDLARDSSNLLSRTPTQAGPWSIFWVEVP